MVIGFLFTARQDQRAEAERELAEQRAQDEALQAYLDQMSQLILDRKLLEAEPGDPVHTLAQARTSTVILRLDAEHNESVTRFLSNGGMREFANEWWEDIFFELGFAFLSTRQILSSGNVAI